MPDRGLPGPWRSHFLGQERGGLWKNAVPGSYLPPIAPARFALPPVTSPQNAADRRPHVLVTGGAGFIGAYVVACLLEKGAQVSVIDDLSTGSLDRLPTDEGLRIVVGDMNEAGPWSEVWQGESPFTRILHLAGHVGVRRVLGDPDGCAESHRAMAQTLVETLNAMEPVARPGLIAASSSEVYRASEESLSEDSRVWNKADEGWGQGRWAYAASKRLAEQGFEGVGPEVLNVRLFNVVGPGQNAESGMVLPRFVEAARLGEALHVYGSGKQVRTFGHVSCIAKDLSELRLRSDMPTGVLNLGGTATTQIETLARTVLQEAGLGDELLRFVDPAVELGSTFEEVVHRIPNLDRARALGLVQSPWSLNEIVRDAWSRHGVPSPG